MIFLTWDLTWDTNTSQLCPNQHFTNQSYHRNSDVAFEKYKNYLNFAIKGINLAKLKHFEENTQKYQKCFKYSMSVCCSNPPGHMDKVSSAFCKPAWGRGSVSARNVIVCSEYVEQSKTAGLLKLSVDSETFYLQLFAKLCTYDHYSTLIQ